MDISALYQKMAEEGIVIRVIPNIIRSVYEPSVIHKDMYPTGTVMYLDEYKRDMLVVYDAPVYAGKVLVVSAKHHSTNVAFDSTKKVYDSLEEAFDAIMEM